MFRLDIMPLSAHRPFHHPHVTTICRKDAAPIRFDDAAAAESAIRLREEEDMRRRVICDADASARPPFDTTRCAAKGRCRHKRAPAEEVPVAAAAACSHLPPYAVPFLPPTRRCCLRYRRCRVTIRRAPHAFACLHAIGLLRQERPPPHEQAPVVIPPLPGINERHRHTYHVHPSSATSSPVAHARRHTCSLPTSARAAIAVACCFCRCRQSPSESTKAHRYYRRSSFRPRPQCRPSTCLRRILHVLMLRCLNHGSSPRSDYAKEMMPRRCAALSAAIFTSVPQAACEGDSIRPPRRLPQQTAQMIKRA